MKLVLFKRNAGTSSTAIRPGLLVDNGVIDISSAVEGPYPDRPQEVMQHIISGFDGLRPELERLATTSTPIPLLDILLQPPLPRPGKILCCTSARPPAPRCADRSICPAGVSVAASDVVVRSRCNTRAVCHGVSHD